MKPSRAAATRSAGLFLVLATAFLRAMTNQELFPRWELDPTITQSPLTGVTPTLSLALDLLALIGCLALIAGEAAAGPRILLWPLALLVVGALPALAHTGVLIGPLSPDALRIASAWIASIASAAALFHACRDPRAARLALALLISFSAILFARGLVQVFIEHPRTLAAYRANRDSFLAARGWTPRSPMALAFERRLEQPEATGWFGLANVYATFMAASLVMLAPLTVLAWRVARRDQVTLPDGLAGVVTLALIAAALGLWWSRSKGGFGAALAGAAAIALALAGARTRRTHALRAWAPLLAPLAVALPLALIALRPLVGERIAELSLLFRWFYVETAARVFAENPLLGVGPDAFTDAYTRLKPPLSPEEVSSPHSLLFDHLARLGIAGLAWSALLIALGSLAARSLFAPFPPPPGRAPPGEARAERWTIIAICVVPLAAAVLITSPALSAEGALALLLGAGFWIGLAISLLATMRASPFWTVAPAAGALAILAHAQVEVTPTWISSAPLFACFLGAAGGAGARERSRSTDPRADAARSRSLPGLLAWIAAITAIALTVAIGTLGVWRWERSLIQAAGELRPIAEVRSLLDLAASGQSSTAASEAAARLSRALGQEVPPTPAALQHAFAELSLRRAEIAQEHLAFAHEVAPAHRETDQARSRLALSAATALIALGRDPTPPLDEAEHVALRSAERSARSAQAWGWLGTVRKARFDLTRDPQALREAIEAWITASRFDPHAWTFPLRIAFAAETLGEEELASEWATQALEVNAHRRLDPLLQLGEEERIRLEELTSLP